MQPNFCCTKDRESIENLPIFLAIMWVQQFVLILLSVLFTEFLMLFQGNVGQMLQEPRQNILII